jgi:hypothetical protein
MTGRGSKRLRATARLNTDFAMRGLNATRPSWIAMRDFVVKDPRFSISIATAFATNLVG